MLLYDTLCPASGSVVVSATMGQEGYSRSAGEGVVVRSHSGNMNSRGLMMILYISPSPVFSMIDVSSR